MENPPESLRSGVLDIVGLLWHREQLNDLKGTVAGSSPDFFKSALDVFRNRTKTRVVFTGY